MGKSRGRGSLGQRGAKGDYFFFSDLLDELKINEGRSQNEERNLDDLIFPFIRSDLKVSSNNGSLKPHNSLSEIPY